MNIAEYYKSLAELRDTIREECIADTAVFSMHSKSHNFLKDYDTLLSAILGEEKYIFSQACREYQHSLEAVISGNYRRAFSSLRLSFELFFGAIYFSAHQLKMKLWLAGHDDLYWATVMDADNGLYSHNFVRGFNSELGQYRSQYMGLAKTVYRECSQYVHANPNTHEDPSLSATYKSSEAVSFYESAETVKLCVVFAFSIRSLLELNLNARNSIEHIILGDLGDLPEIQAVFESQ